VTRELGNFVRKTKSALTKVVGLTQEYQITSNLDSQRHREMTKEATGDLTRLDSLYRLRSLHVTEMKEIPMQDHQDETLMMLALAEQASERLSSLRITRDPLHASRNQLTMQDSTLGPMRVRLKVLLRLVH
jgi:hypothetical protein